VNVEEPPVRVKQVQFNNIPRRTSFFNPVNKEKAAMRKDFMKKFEKYGEEVYIIIFNSFCPGPVSRYAGTKCPNTKTPESFI
jgi:hypothetical protein